MRNGEEDGRHKVRLLTSWSRCVATGLTGGTPSIVEIKTTNCMRFLFFRQPSSTSSKKSSEAEPRTNTDRVSAAHHVIHPQPRSHRRLENPKSSQPQLTTNNSPSNLPLRHRHLHRSNGQRQALHHPQGDEDLRQKIPQRHLRRCRTRVHDSFAQASMSTFSQHLKRRMKWK